MQRLIRPPAFICLPISLTLLVIGNKVSSTPALGLDGTTYAGSDDKSLYAINPDGTKKWSYTTGKPPQQLPPVKPITTSCYKLL